MRAGKLILALLLACSPAAMAWADMVVAANAKSGVEHMTREEVVYVFMGRWRQFPSGVTAVPVDMPADSADYAAFYHQLVNKDPADIKAYWSRLVFSGGARPPRSAQQRDDLLRILLSVPGAIGYIDRSLVDSRMKIVFDFGSSAN